MKKLSTNQLKELKIFNAYEFALYSWWMYYSTSKWHRGWKIFNRSHLNPKEMTGEYDVSCFDKGNIHPDEIKDKITPVLEKMELPYPEEWIKFMGAWWDKAFYDQRMAFLVKEYQEMKKNSQ
jgi:hypothetical protein